MTETRARWFCLADKRSCRLLKAEFNSGGRWHIDEIEALENQWEDDKQHGRPETLASLPERGGAPSFAARPHQEEEEERRFANDAVEWIDKCVRSHDIDELQLFSSPSMIGRIRDAARKDLWSVMREHEANLNPMRTGELVKHPAIERVLQNAG